MLRSRSAIGCSNCKSICSTYGNDLTPVYARFRRLEDHRLEPFLQSPNAMKHSEGQRIRTTRSHGQSDNERQSCAACIREPEALVLKLRNSSDSEPQSMFSLAFSYSYSYSALAVLVLDAVSSSTSTSTISLSTSTIEAKYDRSQNSVT